MKIDEIAREAFQAEIDNQTFREAKAEEIAQALPRHQTFPKKKSRFAMTIAAAIFGCFVFAVSLSYLRNNAAIRPAAKIITEHLPENPKENLVSFVLFARSGMDVEE
jgi:uncharacterized membrane protein (DUF485 family)